VRPTRRTWALALVLSLSVHLAADEVSACSCEGWSDSPFPGSADVPRDAAVRCEASSCPPGSELLDADGELVSGSWSEIEQTLAEQGRPHRLFKPSALLAPHAGHVLRGLNNNVILSFETGDRILGERPDPPTIVLPPFDTACYSPHDSCHRLGLNFSVSILELVFDFASADSLYIDIDCSAALDANGRGGSVAALRKANGWDYLGSDYCSLPGLHPVEPGQTIFARYAALGKNGRLSAWSEVLKIHIPEACGDTAEYGALPIEVSFAGDETPAACAENPGPPDDAPLPAEAFIDAGNPPENATEERPLENTNALGCSASGEMANAALGLLLFLLRKRRGAYR
jgi:hypothetical protein